MIDEYNLQGAKGLLVNITGGSDIKLFEVDAAVNKIRAEVDPEAELIFGAIKDENMNGKIRVSIVATSLKGSTISPEPRPVLNIVNGSNNRKNNFSENLFSKNNLDQDVINSIDGANALKLDESFEIKSNEEQNALIENFESNEENQIAEEALIQKSTINEIPAGVSIESASYMENNSDTKIDNIASSNKSINSDKIDEEYTPKLFSDEQSQENTDGDIHEDNNTNQLFDHDNVEEEDFEIPAFLRRQKF